MAQEPRLQEQVVRREAKSERRPTVLIVTRDGGLFERLAATAPDHWLVEACVVGKLVRRVLADHDVRLVVVDDEALFESERGTVLDQVHRLAAEADIVYIASDHSADRERAVRSRGVLCYTSRPADLDRLERVLRAAFRRDGIPASRTP